MILSLTIQSPISEIFPDTTLFLNPSIGVTGPLRGEIFSSRLRLWPGEARWLSLVNYHHHLFYIREPFVTKKGILTVCLMGETFKLERQNIYQRPVRAGLTSKIWVSLVSVGGQIYLHTSLTRKLRRQQPPSVFSSKVTRVRLIYFTGWQKSSLVVPIWSPFFLQSFVLNWLHMEGEAIRRN